MQVHTSYKSAFHACMESQAMAIAHLRELPPNMNIDTSGCYKIFFLLSGAKKFHIDNRVYDTGPNELYFAGPREWHYFSHFDPEEDHERFVLFLYPEYIKNASSPKTNLTACFSEEGHVSNHNLPLSASEKERILHYLQKLSLPEHYGSDLMDYALFLELLVYVNRLALNQNTSDTPLNSAPFKFNKTITEILSYVDAHLSEDLSIDHLAETFFLSSSYLCKTFKTSTGTTLHKYITAQRITLAKDYLSQGIPTIEVGAMCGYHDYNAFLKAFTKEVGLSPKKYAQLSI